MILTDIRDELRRLGLSVTDTSHVGGGFPDLVVSYGLAVAFVEVKNPKQPPSKWKLSEDEQAFFDLHKLSYAVFTEDDCAWLRSHLMDWNARLVTCPDELERSDARGWVCAAPEWQAAQGKSR